MLLLGNVGDYFAVATVLLTVTVEGDGLGRVGTAGQLLELVEMLLQR